MKVVFNVKNKSYQKEFDNDLFTGRKIGDKIEGGVFGLADYEFKITGGSDSAGFPHRKDVEGSVRRKILGSRGVGVKRKLSRGIMIRKSVMGNTFSANTAQVNLKVVKYGKEALDKVLGVAEKVKEETKEEVKKETPKEEKKPEVKEVVKKEEKKPEVKVEEKVVEKPKEEPKKEEPKVEEKSVEKPKEAEKKE